MRMFASHGRLQEAMDVCTVVANADTLMLSYIISAHVNHVQAKQGIQLCHRMRRLSVKRNGHVFVASLQACAWGADLKTGQQVHAEVFAVEPRLFVCNSLLDRYGKCNSLGEAQRVFDGLGQMAVVRWHTLIAGYSQQGTVSLSQKFSGRRVLYSGFSLVREFASHARRERRRLQFQKSPEVESPHSFGVDLKTAGLAFGAGQDHIDPSKTISPWSVDVKIENLVHIVTRDKDWGPLTERSLQQLHMRLKPYHVREVVKQVESLDLAWNFFRWAGGQPEYEHDSYTKNAMAKRLGEACRFDELMLVLENVEGKCQEKDVFAFTTAMQSLGKAKKPDAAVDLFKKMKQLGCQPDGVTYNCLIAILVRGGRIMDAHSCYKEMLSAGYQPDRYTYSSLITSFGKLGQVDEAVKVFKEMKNQGIGPCVVTYSAMMKAHFVACQYEDAFKMFELMKQEGLVPDVVVYNTLISGLSKDGKVDRALEIFEDMTKSKAATPDSATFCSILDGLAKVGYMDDAVRIFEEMKIGVLPDVKCYNAIMDGHRRAGRVEDVMLLYQEMRQKQVVADLITFNTVIDALSRGGKVDEAYVMFEQLQQEGFTPDVFTYSSLIDALAKASRVREAMGLFLVMKGRGVEPNLALYQVLIGALAKSGQVTEAVKLADEVVEKGWVLGVITFNILIDVVGKAGETSKAYHLFLDMKLLGAEPDEYTYSSLLSSLSKTGKSAEAWKVFEEAKVRGLADAGFHIIMIQGFCKQERWQDALQLYQELRDSGFIPSASLFCGLLSGLQAAGRMDEVTSMIQDMRRCLVNPNDAFCNAFLAGLVRAGQVEEAGKVLRDMKARAMVPDSRVVGTMGLLLDCHAPREQTGNTGPG